MPRPYRRRGEGQQTRRRTSGVTSAMPTRSIVPVERIEAKILLISGQKVMLDADLAELSGVTAKRLNEQGKGNIRRFRRDFVFLLTPAEVEASTGRKLRPFYDLRFPPYAFIEQGAIQVANVLNALRRA